MPSEGVDNTVKFSRSAGLCASAVATAAVIMAGAALPAIAGTGETANYYGCKGHWSGSASWGRCLNTSKTVTIRLQTACSAQSDYTGTWRYISKGSTVDPFDAYDCTFSVQNVSLGFK
jgi:hypothetical protein